MKKFWLFLFLPVVALGAGTMRINQGTTGGTVTIEGSSGGGGGSGTVSTGAGLTGDGSSGSPLAVDNSTVTMLGPSPTTSAIPEGSNLYFTTERATTAVNGIYVQNQATTLQTNSGFFVSTGILGSFTVQQPDNDTSDPAITLETFTTKESATNMLHSLFLNGRIPHSSSNGGEFIITDSSNALDSSVGSFSDRLNRSEIAFEPAGNSGSILQGIALRAVGHQFPNTMPYGDFYVIPSTIVSQNFHQFNNGVSISGTDTHASLSAGVMHVVAVSSSVTTGLVSLSTEVTGTLPLTNLVSSVTVGGVFVAGTNVTVTQGAGITTIAASGVAGSSATAGVTVYNGGVALSTTQAYNRNFYYVPFDCRITSATIMQDSGSITYDVKISSGSAFPTTVSMVGSGTKPILTSGSFTGSPVTDWQQTTIPAGSQLEFTVEAATTTRKSTLVLTLVKT